MRLRVSQAVRVALEERASSERRSMNQMGVLLLEAALGVEPSAGAIPEPVEEPGRRAPREAAPKTCPHPKEARQTFGWGSRCGDCGAKLR